MNTSAVTAKDPDEGVLIDGGGECELRHRRCASGGTPFVPPPGGEPYPIRSMIDPATNLWACVACGGSVRKMGALGA